MTLTEYRPSISEVLASYGAEVEEAGEGWVSVACPFHEDAHKSASVNEGEGLYKCFGCGVQGDAVAVVSKTQGISEGQARAQLKETVTHKKVTRKEHTRTHRKAVPAMLQDATARYAEDIDEASVYLRGRGITRTAAQAARLGFVRRPLPGHEPYRDRLAIPYITTSGVVDMKFRCAQAHSCKEHGHPKYLCLPGSDSRMYHAVAALTCRPYIAVTEGEIDALVLNHLCDVPAVGIPGANQWRSHYARVLEGFDRILVVGDGDKAGAQFSREVVKKLESSVSIVLPDGQDVNDVYLTGGVAEVLNLLGV